MARLNTVQLTEQVEMSYEDLVMQTFQFTTSQEARTREYINCYMGKIRAVLGFIDRGPASTQTSSTATVTFTNATTATQTVVINGRTYTALADPTATRDAFDVGTDATTQALALKKTINADGVAGTDYGPNHTAHDDVVATVAAGVVTLTAIRPGYIGETISLTETCDNCTVSGALFTGSAGADVGARANLIYTYADVNVATETVTIDGVVYTHRAVPGAEANAVDVGTTAAEAARNLAAAINDVGTAGWYGTATVAHPTCFAIYQPGASTVRVYAKKFGRQGNHIAVAETDTNGSWAGAATKLAGGYDGHPMSIRFALNARGTGITEGLNDGDLGVQCSHRDRLIEVTVLGTKPA
jgi:hypothetical protein